MSLPLLPPLILCFYSLETTNLYYLSKISKELYKWNHRLYTLLGLAFFPLYNFLEIHSSYACQYLSLFYCLLYPTVGIFLSLFNYSPVEGCLDCSQFCVMMNKSNQVAKTKVHGVG